MGTYSTLIKLETKTLINLLTRKFIFKLPILSKFYQIEVSELFLQSIDNPLGFCLLRIILIDYGSNPNSFSYDWTEILQKDGFVINSATVDLPDKLFFYGESKFLIKSMGKKLQLGFTFIKYEGFCEKNVDILNSELVERSIKWFRIIDGHFDFFWFIPIVLEQNDVLQID